MLGFLAVDHAIGLSNVIYTSVSVSDCQGCGDGSGFHTDWASRCRQIEACTGTIELTISKNYSDKRRVQYLTFETGYTSRRHPRSPLCIDRERITFYMRERTIGLCKRDALGDKAFNAIFYGDFDNIPRTFVADAGVSFGGFCHSYRVEARRKIGKLMNDDLWFGCLNQTRQGYLVENIGNDWLRA